MLTLTLTLAHAQNRRDVAFTEFITHDVTPGCIWI
jgi:hypothetical protein